MIIELLKTKGEYKDMAAYKEQAAFRYCLITIYVFSANEEISMINQGQYMERRFRQIDNGSISELFLAKLTLEGINTERKQSLCELNTWMMEKDTWITAITGSDEDALEAQCKKLATDRDTG